MRETSASSSSIVIDASLAVWTVLPTIAPIDVSAQVTEWQRTNTRFLAPVLWVAESISSIRRSLYTRAISLDEAFIAIDDLFDLEVETRPLDLPLCRSALLWAGRLGQSRAYDAFYLALAEDLAVEFWTADRRLANAAAQAGATWAHWIGEPVTGS